jgi:hypothetical protein
VVDFHDPRAPTRIESTPYGLKTSLQPGMTIGLLANGFPDSESFLDAIAGALQERHPGLALKSWNKGNASVPASAEMLAEIETSCDAAIAAYGH